MKSLKKYKTYFLIVGISIFSVTLSFSQQNTTYRSYYESNVDWTNLPSFYQEGRQQDAFSKGETAFRKKAYKSAVAHFSAVKPSHQLYANSLVYLGASYDKLNQNDKAIAAFKQLTKQTSLYVITTGYWYEAMIHLKVGNKEKAIEALENVKYKKHYRYETAKIIVSKLK